MTESNSHDGEELRLLYDVTISDLSYFKMQQWAVTNYGLLIDGGLIGIAQLIKPLDKCDRWVLAALACFGAAAALVVLGKLQRSIDIRRKRLSNIRSKFGEAFMAAWSAGKKDDEYMDVGRLLIGAVVLTALLTVWLLWCRFRG
jgi:hypothetical protein